MITLVLGNDEELELETLEDARFCLERVECAIDDGAKGLEPVVAELQDIIAEGEAECRRAEFSV